MKIIELRGARVPALGLGTWQLTGAGCTRAVRTALDIGYRHVDTAEAYGNEAEVGAGLRESGVDRGLIFLTTKVWYENLRPADFKRSVAASLRRLGTDYVDLLLIHWPNPSIPLGESLGALQEVRAEGKVRFVGVSNFTVRLLKESVGKHGADLLCDQVEYHPFLSQNAVLGYLRANDMMLTAYSPLARGKVVDDPTLGAIGGKYGKNAGQVALRWLVEQDGVAAIPRSSSERHIRANFEIFDFELSHEDKAAIDRLAGNQRFVSPSWA
ncbi:MAG TPA: aldo/keto reductase, partial [Geminicoccaceae bacterium]|nr:aldo/keto reductase [Geminicoccaceae bacterium]